MPACVGCVGRSAQMQWLGRSLQPSQRSPLGPPRARNGRVLRDWRSARRRDTAWGRTDGLGVVEAEDTAAIVVALGLQRNQAGLEPLTQPLIRRCFAGGAQPGAPSLVVRLYCLRLRLARPGASSQPQICDLLGCISDA